MQDILLFGAGLLVGAMNAVAGGGMLVGFPILLAVGMPALAANVTSSVVAAPGSLSSAYGYRKYIRKVPKRYLFLIVPCVIGALSGATILRNTSSDRFQEIVPGLVLLAVVLFAFQPYLHFRLHNHLKGKAKGYQTLLLVGLALLPVAVYGGYFGAGFGFIMLAFLGFTKLRDVHKMNGLKNLAGASVSISSFAVLYSTHLINWHYGLVMAAGGMIGGYYGSVLSQKVSTHTVRFFVIFMGLATATYLGFRSY